MSEPWNVWDPAQDIETADDVALYLNSIMEENPLLLPEALGDIARSKGMSEIADRSGLGRESLYKALSKTSQPRYSTITKVLNAMGLELRVVSVV